MSILHNTSPIPSEANRVRASFRAGFRHHDHCRVAEMEGLLTVPPERGTIIGRAIWKVRSTFGGTPSTNR